MSLSSGRCVFFQLAAKVIKPQWIAITGREEHDYQVDLDFIKINLYDKVVPKTCTNFEHLATFKEGFGYPRTVFHQIVKGFGMYGGDVVPRKRFLQPFDRVTKDLDWHGAGDMKPFSTPTDIHSTHPSLGKLGRSIYGPVMYDNVYEDESFFEDENFDVHHDKPGIVTMANSGPHTNTSKFVILTAPAPYLDERNVAFGEVAEGLDTLQDITDTLGSLCGQPTLWVEIVQSGILESVDDRLPPKVTLEELNSYTPPDPLAYLENTVYSMD